MYYLQSRYYDPIICRFISPDNTAVLTATPMALTDKNLYAYCDNNPVMRVDEDGEFWTAIIIGAVVGIVVQYVGDVIGNIESGKTGEDIFAPTSSLTDYIAAAVGGGIAATPVSSLAGVLFTGAVANVFSDLIKGDIKNGQDLLNSGLKGAVANGVGYSVGKFFAKVKADKILSMPRATQKNYLTDFVFKNSRSLANANLHTFRDNPIGVVEGAFKVFQYGIYSTWSSTIFGKVVYD